MLLTTPRVDSFQQNLFKKEWRSYHRDHLTLFTKPALCRIVKKAGFEIIKIISWGGIAKDLGFPGWLKNLTDRTMKFINKGDVMFILARNIKK